MAEKSEFRYSVEARQNGKGYFQISVKVRSDYIEDVADKQEKLFDIVKAQVEKQGYKVQPIVKGKK